MRDNGTGGRNRTSPSWVKAKRPYRQTAPVCRRSCDSEELRSGVAEISIFPSKFPGANIGGGRPLARRGMGGGGGVAWGPRIARSYLPKKLRRSPPYPIAQRARVNRQRRAARGIWNRARNRGADDTTLAAIASVVTPRKPSNHAAPQALRADPCNQIATSEAVNSPDTLPPARPVGHRRAAADRPAPGRSQQSPAPAPPVSRRRYLESL